MQSPSSKTSIRARLAALTFAISVLFATALLAAEEPAPGPRAKETVLSLILKGRWIMIPMGICSVITLTFAIERATSWRKSRVGSVGLVDEIFKAVPDRDQATRESIARGIQVCDESKSILGRVLRSGVEKLHRDEAHAQQHLEDTASREAHVLKRRVRVFSVISALSPLLGLLGTISGMITCFEKATEADSGSRVTTLTQGIYEALVATATGLLIAIVALILYHYFMGVVDRIVDKIDEAALKFLEHYYAVADVSHPRPVTQGRASAHRNESPRREEGGKAAAGARPAIEAER